MDLQNISEGNFKITTNKSIILMAGSIIAGYAADEKVREILNKNRNKNSEKFVLAVNDGVSWFYVLFTEYACRRSVRGQFNS